MALLHRLCLASLGALALGSCAGWAQDEAAPPAVTVVEVHLEDVTLTTTLPGRVVAAAEAEVRPEVAGIVTERHFREGSTVSAGDVLYTIDGAAYSAAMMQAEAALAQAQASFDAAMRDANRIETLSSRNVASQQTLDDAAAARDIAAAAVLGAGAELRTATIAYERTTIRARLSGEIGLSRTSPGALVTASQVEPMAVIRSIDTVFVDVTQSAADLLQWRRGLSTAETDGGDRPIALILADGTLYEQTGALTAAEPHVDEQTGVVLLRIAFDNPDKLLLPGMYVQVEMPTRTVEDVVLAPQEAVGRNRLGEPIALVAGADNRVEERSLTVLQERGAFWIVSAGLAPGDLLIVEGLQRAQPGVEVTPELRAEPRPAEAPERQADGAEKERILVARPEDPASDGEPPDE